MKILIWKTKYGDRYFDASSPKKEEASALKVFKDMKNDGFYNAYLDPKHVTMYAKALSGDGKAALMLLRNRSDYEYEGISFEDVEE